MSRTGFMEETIRSVKEGDTLTFPLSEVNQPSWRAKVGLINNKDGYRHYSVAVNTKMDILGIVNNGDRYKTNH